MPIPGIIEFSNLRPTDTGETIVYVPYYNPTVVYGPWWYPEYPPFYWAPWPGYYARPGFGTGFFWGSGITISTGFFFGGHSMVPRHLGEPQRHA